MVRIVGFVVAVVAAVVVVVVVVVAGVAAATRGQPKVWSRREERVVSERLGGTQGGGVSG